LVLASAKIAALDLVLGSVLEQVWAEMLVAAEWVLVLVPAWAVEWVQA